MKPGDLVRPTNPNIATLWPSSRTGELGLPIDVTFNVIAVVLARLDGELVVLTKWGVRWTLAAGWEKT